MTIRNATGPGLSPPLSSFTGSAAYRLPTTRSGPPRVLRVGYRRPLRPTHLCAISRHVPGPARPQADSIFGSQHFLDALLRLLDYSCEGWPTSQPPASGRTRHWRTTRLQLAIAAHPMLASFRHRDVRSCRCPRRPTLLSPGYPQEIAVRSLSISSSSPSTRGDGAHRS